MLKSVQNLIRGKHQCLVAEIRFGDPIPLGATPAANENLSQRNLAIVESDNPGPEDAHTIAHTFELRTTLRKSEREFVNTDGHLQRFNLRPIESAFDELMIVWGGVPEDAEATLYLPALRADDIIAAASLRYGPPRIEKVDERTIRCRIGDITYVPLPAIGPTQVAGLLTIVLPQTVKTGQNFRVILHQHSRAQGRIAGLRSGVPVQEAKELLPSEARLLAVFKSIAASIRPNSIWFPVFQRYLATIDGRVRGLGGNPDLIGPSPTGNVPDGALPIPPGTPGVDSFGLIDKCCKEVARACGRPCGSLSRPSCCLSSCFSY